jgi:biopolymer transport protein ExbB
VPRWLGLRRAGKALFYRDSMKIVLTGLASLALSPTLLAQSAEPAPAAEFMRRANLWQLLQAGGPAMIPLGILSVITVMLVIAFLFSLRRGSIVTKRFMQTADALIRKRDFLGLLAVSNRHNEAIARVVQRMMNFLTKNPKATMAEIREIAQTEGMRQASALNQQVAYLADIGTIAPMVGLLGTVVGIVRSFGVIAIDAAASRPTMLAQGIGEALIATAAGLLIGIPAMAAYAFFRGRAHALISDLEAASTQLLALLSTIGVKSPPAGVQAESVEVS